MPKKHHTFSLQIMLPPSENYGPPMASRPRRIQESNNFRYQWTRAAQFSRKMSCFRTKKKHTPRPSRNSSNKLILKFTNNSLKYPRRCPARRGAFGFKLVVGAYRRVKSFERSLLSATASSGWLKPSVNGAGKEKATCRLLIIHPSSGINNSLSNVLKVGQLQLLKSSKNSW